MEEYTELIIVLNDLIRINMDRGKALKKRINNPENDSDVQLFKRLIRESTEFIEQLIMEVKKKSGKAINTDNNTSGTIYYSWKELKSWLLQKKELSPLEMVQFETKSALQVYRKAIFEVTNIPADTLDLVASQKALLKEDCEIIKAKLVLS
ncbi:MAG TPA: hypothetical protein VN726_15170 [Hanamia sp.]|nr:hypothetical protein [Hanamia sp.]